MTAQEAILFLCEEKQVQKDEGGKLKMTIAYRIKWLSQNVEEQNIERWLKAVLSHPEFKYVANGFLPSLALMDEVCRPSKAVLELEAENQFDLIMKKLSRWEHLKTSNHRLAAGLTAIGGWIALCDSEDESIPYRRKEFVRAYCNSTQPLSEPITWHGLSQQTRTPICIDDNGGREQITHNPAFEIAAKTAERMVLQ